MNGYSQQELKSLSLTEAQALAEEIRRLLVEQVSLTGGHLASNLGVVEISLGILRVFSLPKDQILYDTGHQSYVHKILTGRMGAFDSLRQYGGISGFPRRSESEYDAFGAGHSGTALSAAIGLSRAAALNGVSGQHTVAVLGDGTLTNGMVYEAMNNLKKDDRLILVLNDNEMSISKSVGSLARYLSRVRKSETYFSLKKKSHSFLSRVPLVGRGIESFLSRVKAKIKSFVYRGNLLAQLGFNYLGPANGNSLEEVETLLREAKQSRGPVLLHFVTKKGKGYAPAETNPGKYHSVSSSSSTSSRTSFSRVFGQTLTEMASKDKRIVAITAAMEEGTGLDEFHRQFPRRFFDVGIAEEHAMTFAGGLSAGKMKPVFAVYSTFFQRAYDQLFHDLCLQKLGAMVVLDRAGFADTDGPTHHGLFDVSLSLQLPGTQVYSPATYDELRRLTQTLLLHQGEETTLLRFPKGEEKEEIVQSFACKSDTEFFESGEHPRVLILTYGRITEQALLASKLLLERKITCTVTKLVCLKPFDVVPLSSYVEDKSFDLCYCLEEGVAEGGFFEGLFADILTGKKPALAKRYHIRAVEDEYVPHGTYRELLCHCKMDAESVCEEIVSLL